MNDPLYIVSGFMRSGTSMMMECLEKGGMDIVYSEKRNVEMNKRWGEPAYVPNHNYYELDLETYLQGDLATKFAGKAVKCLWGGLLRLPPAHYRVIVMRRPYKEIRRSLIASFGADNAANQFRDLDTMLDNVVAVMRDRRSVTSLDVVQYHDMLDHPQTTLSALSWPIDAAKAATIPDRLKARFDARNH